jgi:hypothetical protein
MLLLLSEGSFSQLDSDQQHDVLLCQQVTPIRGRGGFARATTIRLGGSRSRPWDP